MFPATSRGRAAGTGIALALCLALAGLASCADTSPQPATATPSPATAHPAPIVNDNANLRAGPDTEHDRVGSVAQGDAVEIVARNAAGDWYHLAGGAWIAAFPGRWGANWSSRIERGT